MEKVRNTKHKRGGGVRSPACTECGMTFNTRDKLNRHFRIHTGEKPYACSLCNLSFNQSLFLKMHTRRHKEGSAKQSATSTQARVNESIKNPTSSSSNEKTVVSSLNPKVVLTPLSNKNIPQMNKVGDEASKKPNYECPLCKTGFMHSANLQRHMNIHASSIQGPVSTHTVEKRHECPLCGMKFGLVSNLQNHMRFHAAELEHGAYDCPFCSKKFTSQSAFSRHQRSHFLIEDESLAEGNGAGKKSVRCRTGQVDAAVEEATCEKDVEHYTCCLCGQKFDSVLDICNHMQAHCSQESQPCLTEHDPIGDDKSMPYYATIVTGGGVPCLTVRNNPVDDESMPELTEPNHLNIADVDNSKKALPCLTLQPDHNVAETNSEQKSMPCLTELDGPNAVVIDANHNTMPCLAVQHTSDSASGIEMGIKKLAENGTLKHGDRINTGKDILPTDSMKLYCMNYIKEEESQRRIKQHRKTIERNIFEVANLMKDARRKEQTDTPERNTRSQNKDQASKTIMDPQNASNHPVASKTMMDPQNAGNHPVTYIQVPTVRTMRMKARFKTSSAIQNWNPTERNDSVMDATSPEKLQVDQSFQQATGAETHDHSQEDKLCPVDTSSTNSVTEGKEKLCNKSIPVYYKCGVCSYVFRTAALRDQHMKVHLVKKLLKCMPCGDHFVDSTSLLAHLKTSGKCATRMTSVMSLQSHITTHLEDKKETSLLGNSLLPTPTVSTILQTPVTEPAAAQNTCTKVETQPVLEICTENEVRELQTHARAAVCPTDNSPTKEGKDTGSDKELAEQMDAESQTLDWEPVCTEQQEESQSGWEVCMDQGSSVGEDTEIMDAEWELHVDDEAEPSSTSAQSVDTWDNSYAGVKAEQMHHTFRICGDEVTVFRKADTDTMMETDHRAEMVQTSWPTIKCQLSTEGIGSLSNPYTTDPVDQTCVKTEQHLYAEQHQCAKCGERFNTLSDLRLHDEEHKSKKAYQCSVCELRFYQPGELVVHSRSHTQEDYTRIQQQELDRARILKQEKDEAKMMKSESSHQPSETKYKIQYNETELEVDIKTGGEERTHNCSICSIEITPSARDVQLQAHKYVPLKCTECYDRFYKHRVDGDTNKSTHTESTYKYTYDRLYKLKVDQTKEKSTHSEATHQHQSSTPKSQILVALGEEGGAMKCVQCGANFNDLTHFSAHMEKHRRKKADESKQRTIERYYCTECGEHFKYVFVLKAHMKTHSKEESFKCAYCDIPFSSSSQLSRHIVRHTGEKFYRCAPCKRTFFTSTELNQHVLQQHGSEGHKKPYECSHCGRRFSSAGAITAHLKSHIQNETVKCSHCEQRFDTNAELADHNETHKELRPLTCYACNGTFTRWDYLNRHVITVHRNYQDRVCPYCGDYCTDTKTVNEHLRRHAVEKIHPCPECGERFESYKVLNQHTKKVHTGRTPYKCEHCSCVFRKPNTLKNHMLTSHKNIKRPDKSHSKVKTPATEPIDKKAPENDGVTDRKIKTVETDMIDREVKIPRSRSTEKNVKTAKTKRLEGKTPDTHSTDRKIKTPGNDGTGGNVKSTWNDCSAIKVEIPDNDSRDIKNPGGAITYDKVTIPHNNDGDIKVKTPKNYFSVKSEDKDIREFSKESSRNAADKVTSAGRGRLQCNYCQKCFLRRRNLNQHMRDCGQKGGLCSTPIQGMECSTCVQNPSAPATHLHILPHTSYSRCGACVMGFSQPVYLEKHLAAHADVL